jgi:RNA recognition motif-containing protein
VRRPKLIVFLLTNPSDRSNAEFQPGLFFVERKYGPVVTPEEVQDLLQSFGKIEFCRAATHVERTALNLNDGAIVQFEMYDEGQAAHSVSLLPFLQKFNPEFLKAFRNHELYKLQAIAGLASPSRAAPSRSPSKAENRAYLERYEVDRRSVFVGNLPLGTTETQLLQLFEHYGTIDHIILRETASKFEST